MAVDPRSWLKDFDGIAVRVKGGKLEIIDQREIPDKEVWLPCDTLEQVYGYIHSLATRGAPMIGCVAALALAVYSVNKFPETADIVAKSEYLKQSRPTAVNLMYACDYVAQKSSQNPDFSAPTICRLAYEVLQKEIDMCDKMSENGAALIKEGENILTHCNTGSLATPGVGTALGVIRLAHKQGKKIHVYVDETRPLLQGGRLTAYELHKEGIPFTLICDNMAAALMRQGKINRVLVGADRIALNGDTANKIGTYSVAVLAKHHNIPFHPVAPLSTVDFQCVSGASIPIEERSPSEVLGAIGKIRWAPAESPVWNPAFDVTPISEITSIIFDCGVVTKAEIESGVIKTLQKKRD